MKRVKILSPNIALTIQKKKLSVRIPIKMLSDIEMNMKKEGLSLRLRSRWISQAIIDLENLTNYQVNIEEEWMDPGGNILITVNLEPESDQSLTRMVKKLTGKGLDKDIKSSIIRTAIIQKILKSEENSNVK